MTFSPRDWLERGLGKLVPPWFWGKLFRFALRRGHRAGDRFLTFHARPKRADDVGAFSELPPVPVGIVLTGPLLSRNDFTRETIQLYRRRFPNCPVIVSTWTGENRRSVETIRGLGVEVLLNDKPSRPGPRNVNLQLTTARAGVERCAALGVDWVLKSRTDQRCYASNFPAFLIGLATAFPLAAGTRQRKRLIHLSTGSSKYVMYSLSDMAVFGDAHDMLEYWSAPHRESISPCSTIGEVARNLGSTEVYLTVTFLRKMGREPEWTILDSWRAYRDHFAIADEAALDLFWPQSGFDDEYRLRRYDGIHADRELSFVEWLNLYAGLESKVPPGDLEPLGPSSPVPRGNP